VAVGAILAIAIGDRVVRDAASDSVEAVVSGAETK